MDEDLRQALAAIETRLTRIETRLTRIETKVDAIPILLPSVRDRLAVIDAALRSQGAILGRLEDSLTMDVLERIRALENR